MDDLVLTVRQISQYPLKAQADDTDLLLIQSLGPGGPTSSITPQALVSTALLDGTPLNLAPNGQIAWDGMTLSFIPGQGFTFSTQVNLPTLNSHNILINGQPAATIPFVTDTISAIPIVNTFNGRTGDVALEERDILQAGAAPVTNPHFAGVCTAPTIWNPEANDDLIATTAWVQLALCHWYNLAKQLGTIVTSFDGRGGDVTLIPDDITQALTSTSGQFAFANTPPLGDASGRIATTLFVDGSMSLLQRQLELEFNQIAAALDQIYAPLNSPQFTGIPTAPTAAQTVNSGQLATTAFVHAAVTASTTGVSSFNTRTGAVTFLAADLTAVGGALTASPTFTGLPLAPTATPGTANQQIATTAFVNAAINAIPADVSSFNTRTGAVVLTAADVTAVGGALLASPALTGAPTAPTAAQTVNNTQLATTAYVRAAIAGLPALVTSFNGRTGAITFQSSDISAAGGALLVSPIFTGAPTAPTQVTGTSDQTIATTQFVANTVASVSSGVTTFNGRTGAVVLTTADITSAGGAVLASPTFTGVPLAPTASAGTNSQQLATTAFVTAALASAPGGVSSFNGRTGAITLQASDISAVNGALLTSPSFTGAPTAPTPAPGNNSTAIATTQFIATAIAAAGGVTSFNGRAGTVTLTTADIVAAGAATVAINDVAPPSPTVGQLWWDSTAALMYMYYQDPNSSQWVNVNNASGVTEAPTDGRLYLRQGSTTSWQPQPPVSSAGVQGHFKNLVVNGASPNAHSAAITADAITVSDGASSYATLLSINQTCDLSTSGAGGLDTGSLAVSTWYALYIIYNPSTTTRNSLASLSATAPTLPSGYTQYARVGWVRMSATAATLMRTLQNGRKAQYVVTGTAPNSGLPIIASGVAGTVTTTSWTGVAYPVTSFVPATAATIRFFLTSANPSGAAGAAPNASYGAPNSATNPVPLYLTQYGGFNFEWVLESTNIYYAGNQSASLMQCLGWEDNL